MEKMMQPIDINSNPIGVLRPYQSFDVTAGDYLEIETSGVYRIACPGDSTNIGFVTYKTEDNQEYCEWPVFQGYAEYFYLESGKRLYFSGTGTLWVALMK